MASDEYMRMVLARNATAGYRIYWMINSVIVSRGIFDANQNDLHARLSEYSDPKIAAKLWRQGEHFAAQQELREIVRLIHNYIASVKSLIDHTRIVAKQILVDASFDQYQKRVDAFKDDTASKFLHRLRDFTLHITNPPIRARLNLAEMSSEIYLDSALLLEWEDWSRSNREFIESRPGGIALLPLVEDYDHKVQAFYDWLIEYFQDARRVEMEEFWTRQDEWAHFCRSTGIPITELEFRKYFQRSESL